MRTNQLRCTDKEVMAFFKEVMSFPLPADIIQEVTARTEGWLVGLQLLGLSLQRHTNPTDLLDEVNGSQRYILDYLMEEVLRRLPLSVQTFLLRTSILERLSAPLCDAMLELRGSQECLEFLERANVFVVPLDGQRRWYRYHGLFAQALRSRLEQTEGQAVSALHLRASRWYAEQGFLTEAIRHAMSAHDWPRAADLIQQEYTSVWCNHEHAMVRGWLEKLPVEVLRVRPRLCLAYAKTLFMVAPYITIERWLHYAERALRATGATSTTQSAETGAHLPPHGPEWENLFGEIAAYRAIITGYYLGEGAIHPGVLPGGPRPSPRTESRSACRNRLCPVAGLPFPWGHRGRHPQHTGGHDARTSRREHLIHHSLYEQNGVFLALTWKAA